jgi:hypothetical protein
MLKSILDKISVEEALHDAESSYYFLKDYFSYTDWNLYSTKHYPSDLVLYLTKSFCTSHGQINLVNLQENANSIWSINPLGIFRYRMDSNNFWQEVGYLNKIDGYLVEGAYWNNGFFYQVIDNKNVLEINLFIDETTRIRYKYPETPHRTL